MPSASWGLPGRGLVLSRKVGQEVIIGTGDSEVVVIVEYASGSTARLRIIAGGNVPIRRPEIFDGKLGEEG